MDAFLAHLVGYIWSKPVVYGCLCSGIFFSLRLMFIQFRCFPHAIGLISGRYDNPNEPGQITHFQALTAALSATIGLGNIAGVAIAIAIGGPGAVLWMWVVGILGMATKYVECALGTHYRQENPDGTISGGPMYYILKGLGGRFTPLAWFYAGAISIASFGAVSMFQTHEAASALNLNYNVPFWLTGIIIMSLTGIVIIGGIKRIGIVASKVVPSMCFIYLLGALAICGINYKLIPDALMLIISDAFSGEAAAGGMVTAVIMAGVRRAVFSNEAGLGSAAIAHAAVKTNYPIREGIVASLGPFIDTIIVCTATALVIIMSGNFGTEMYQYSSGTQESFETHSLPLNDNWTIKSTGIPDESETLRKFRHGKHVLSYQHQTATTHHPIKLSNISTETGHIRFSYFLNKGGLALRILSPNGDVLSQSEMGKNTSFQFKSNTSQPFATFNGQQHLNKWSSAVISLSSDAKMHLKNQNISEIDIELIPIGNIELLYIDRIQTVTKTEGIKLTITAFDRYIKGFGSIFITIAVFFFAFSTLITWSYYGQTGAQFIFGNQSIPYYRWLYIAFIFIGAIQPLSLIISFSDAMIGLLVIPNTIATLLLSHQVAKWTSTYFKKLANKEIIPFK